MTDDLCPHGISFAPSEPIDGRSEWCGECYPDDVEHSVRVSAALVLHAAGVPFPFADELERVHARIYPPVFRNHAEEIDAVLKGIHPNLKASS